MNTHEPARTQAETSSLNPADTIRLLRRRTELLAPAGRADALDAVLEAGADAVYISGKRFQMRAHRTDFHFDDNALRRAVETVHQRDKRVYVTVNVLLGQHEVAGAREFLGFLDTLGMDGVIVCDLATLRIAGELGLHTELHASTMMNVHDIDQALVLRDLGVARVVTSRDISIREAGLLSERSGLAVEYFLHGDMCVAQSGHCAMSGLVFGKSANRGECMKPCRWEYELVNLRDGVSAGPLREGHLMALRDLALLRNIPELVEAGIWALKIEGRMRDAKYLAHVVRIYREALDGYYDMPGAWTATSDLLERLFRDRVRELSCLACTGAPSHAGFFDVSGKREPLMLSNGAREAPLDIARLTPPEPASADTNVSRAAPALAVSVSSLAAADAALDAGADRVYLAAETSQYEEAHWTPSSFRDAATRIVRRGAALGVRTPRVTATGARPAWRALLALCPEKEVRYVLVHHLGALKRARDDLPHAIIVADYGFNAFNGPAIETLHALGAAIVTPGLEAGLEDVAAMAREAAVPLELIAHGPVAAMLIDHCMIATHLSRSGGKDVCRGPCKHARFALRDRTGEVRHIIADQFCRNHVLTALDVAILPALDTFLRIGPASLRIEAQWYAPALVGALTRAYRDAMDRWADGATPVAPPEDDWMTLMAAAPRPWNFGGYAQRITRSASTAAVMRGLT